MNAESLKWHMTSLYVPVKDYQWPIVYSAEYNITLCGIERLQAYDTCKGGNVLALLKEAGLVDEDTIVKPRQARNEDLLIVHSKSYLENLKWGTRLAGVRELPPVGLLPNFLVNSKVLQPLRYQTGGTVLAVKLAVERGWSVNLGGGFHHCSSKRGAGFCAYADITLAVRLLLRDHPDISRVMIVDLDASQANGIGRDFLDDNSVYIFDMYNRSVYPQDGFAKRGIRRKIELEGGTADDEYLQLLHRHLNEALDEFDPHLVVYIAGTAVLSADEAGGLSLTPQGIVDRDQIVVQRVRTRGLPIAVITGGGYTRTAASVVAHSILNLYHLGLISGPSSALFPSLVSVARRGSVIPLHSAETTVWSRIRTMNQSVSNFMSSAKILSSKPTIQQHHGAHTQDAESEGLNGGGQEIGRCVSMPNIKEDFVRNIQQQGGENSLGVLSES